MKRSREVSIIVDALVSNGLIEQRQSDRARHIVKEAMYQKGDYRALAAYIAKPLPTTDENFEQLNLFDDFSQKEIKQLAKYGRSRNLVVPEPEVKKYVKRTMKNIIENGPKAREGYYIDKDSIRMGINPITGLSYVYYTEVKQKQEMRPIRYIPEENINKSKRKRREVS